MMHLTTIAAAVFAFNVAPTLSYVYSTQSICTTRLGPNSVNPVKTSSYVLTIPITFTKKATVTPTSTITPPPVTTTSTVTSTTTSTVLTTPTTTVTETDTETDTSTFSSTVTSTETDTTTTTTTPAAVTVPSAAGFTPLASEASYNPKKRSEGHAEGVPAIRGRTAQKSLNKCPPIGNPGKFSPSQYPTSVICGALVEQITTSTKTYTASTTAKTTIAPVTSTVTTTTTNTVTTTSTPATVVLTSTTTTTLTTSTTTTTTQTSTTTTTSTVVAPTPTSYAACAPNNVVGSANGGFGIYQPSYSVQIAQYAITDPVACCAQCQTTASCVGFAQYPGGPCYVFTNPSAQCDGSQSFGDIFQTSTGVGAGQGYFVGNGNCGQFDDGGSVN